MSFIASGRRLALLWLTLCLALIASVSLTSAFNAHDLQTTSTNTSSVPVARNLAPKKGKRPADDCVQKKTTPQTLQIDTTTGDNFKASIEAARTLIKKNQELNVAKNKMCSMTEGWTMVVKLAGEADITVDLGNDMYMMFKDATLEYPDEDVWDWTYYNFVDGLQHPKTKNVRNAYSIAEAIRFDWVMNKMATVLDVAETRPDAGFKMPKKALLNNWSNMGKPIGLSEADANKRLTEEQFKFEWVPKDLF